MNPFKKITYWMFQKLAENIPSARAKGTQTYIATSKFRYPDLFHQVRKYLEKQGNSNPDLLSFGCSIGEELITLRKLIPNAHLTGIDKNPLVLWLAKKRTTDLNVELFSDLEELPPGSAFDVIFALAVLQRTDDHGPVKKVFRFENFCEWVAKLDGYLKKDGLFVIENADFDFSETPTAERYEPLQWTDNLMYMQRALFDKNSRKVPARALNRIFIKKG